MGDYTIPLGVANIVKEGTDVTVVGWGGQMNVLKKVCIIIIIYLNLSFAVLIFGVSRQSSKQRLLEFLAS